MSTHVAEDLPMTGYPRGIFEACCFRNSIALSTQVQLTSAGAGSSWPRDRFGMRRALDHHLSQRGIERMFRVRPIEPVIAVAAAQDEFCSLKLCEFVLHRLKREEAQTRQLSHIQFLPWIGKQELKDLRSHHRKQRV